MVEGVKPCASYFQIIRDDDVAGAGDIELTTGVWHGGAR